MNLRCKQCHDTVWVQPDDSFRTAEATCQGCGQHYEWKAWDKLRGSGDQLGDDARKLALQKAIDLPDAYSVLLGVMSLEEVRELSGGQAGGEASPNSEKGRYDPAFGDAVAKGYLTPKQAMERGRREVYVAKLSQRRRLPPDMAYAVADNRISLVEALRKSRTDDSVAASFQTDSPGGNSLPWMLMAGVAIALVLLAFLALRSPAEEIAGSRLITNVGDATIVTNSGGEVLMVAAPNPRSVLHAYCSAGGAQRAFEKISVVPISTPRGRARLGLLRHSSEPENFLSILIEEDLEEGRWFVGDGTTLVVPGKAPAGVRRQAPSPTRVAVPPGSSNI